MIAIALGQLSDCQKICVFNIFFPTKKAAKKQLLTAFGCLEIQYFVLCFSHYMKFFLICKAFPANFFKKF